MRFGSQCEPSVRLVLQKCCLYDPMETLSWFCPCVWLTRPHLSPSLGPPRLAASHSNVSSGTDLCRTCLILCSCREGPLVPGFTLWNAGSVGFRGAVDCSLCTNLFRCILGLRSHPGIFSVGLSCTCGHIHVHADTSLYKVQYKIS